MDRKYLLTALGYAALGMILGIVMAASHNHIQHVTHAHILLVGFVVSFVYAVCYRVWLPEVTGTLVTVQFIAHQLGTLGMVTGCSCSTVSLCRWRPSNRFWRYPPSSCCLRWC